MDSAVSYEPLPGLIAFVNPLQGTDSVQSFSTGNTLPLIAQPHGMTHWSPQTNLNNDRWFFHPRDRVFNGIRATHQPSPWMGDYGHFTLMPQSGPFQPTASERSSAYRTIHHRPDFFAAYLYRDGWQLTLAPTERCALLSTIRDSTLAGKPIRLLLERFGSDEPAQWDKEANCVRGSTRQSRGGVTENWACHFVLYPTAPITEVSDHKTPDGRTITRIEFHPDTKGFETRIGTSFISTEQAAFTLSKEIGSASSEQVAHAGATRWNALLGRFTISGDPEQKRTFYSCLYRALLFPRALHEPDAKNGLHHFSPYTGKVAPGVLYTDSGFWDTFRTVYPLLSVAYPDLLGSMIDGWLNAYRESGFLPEWASPGHRAVMIGTHSQSVIADAVTKGIRGFDYETALDAVVKGATTPVPDDAGYGRARVAEYDTLGYVPCDRIDKATSRTLDYAYDDYCVAQIARVVGRTDLYHSFMTKSERWRNVFDPETKFFRGRLASGAWQEPFDPLEWGGAFVEGSAWQFRFSVPHNPAGLAQLFGGADVMTRAIRSMATSPALYHVGSYGGTIHEMTEMAVADFGQYAQSNQPVHATLHMAAAVGDRALTDHWVRRVLSEYYSADNLPGDEDNGEMAAWYILAAIGLFPLCPGSGMYVLNAPLLPKVEIAIPDKKTLRITSDPALVADTNHPYTVEWNGKAVSAASIPHETIAPGGELRFRIEPH